MNTVYFHENPDSKGYEYLSKAIKDLNVIVSDKTTVQELFTIHNAIFARAIDLMLEDNKKQPAVFG